MDRKRVVTDIIKEWVEKHIALSINETYKNEEVEIDTKADGDWYYVKFGIRAENIDGKNKSFYEFRICVDESYMYFDDDPYKPIEEIKFSWSDDSEVEKSLESIYNA